MRESSNGSVRNDVSGTSGSAAEGGGLEEENFFCDASYGTEAEKNAAEWVQAVQRKPFKKFETGTFSRNVKSGASLCHLVNSIRPGVVPTVHESPLGIKQKENAENFREALLQLGVPAKGLCSVEDIQEMKSTSRVVHSLHLLAVAVQDSAPDFVGPFLKIAEDFENFSEKQDNKAHGDTGGENTKGEAVLSLDMDELDEMAPPCVLSSRAQQVCPEEVVNSPRAIAANLDPASLPPRTPSKRTPNHTSRLNMSGSCSWRSFEDSDGAGGGGTDK